MIRDTKMPVIFVADDNPDDRVLFEHLLRKAGVENPVTFADGGVMAIASLRRSCPAGGGRRGRKPAIVFLDLNMPDLDGFRVLAWIRRRKAFRSTKVVMLTDSNDPADLRRAEALHADGYLLKYPRPDTLALLVRIATKTRGT